MLTQRDFDWIAEARNRIVSQTATDPLMFDILLMREIASTLSCLNIAAQMASTSEERLESVYESIRKEV